MSSHIREIISKELVLARLIRGDEWPDGLSFGSDDNDFLQVGTWRYPADTDLKAHIHNPVDRNVGHTQEAVFVKRGRLLASIYDPDGSPVEDVTLETGDLLVLLHGGHGYRILEDDTQILEVKNGPFVGAELDRRRLSNQPTQDLKALDKIPQFEPLFGEEERRALDDYMAGGGWITEFRKTAEFEESIARYTGARHCIVVNSGTVALTAAYLGCGIGPGDYVLVPNYTMIATATALSLIGANPVFADVEKSTLCLDIKKVEAAMNADIKAVVLVSANGRYPEAGIGEFVDLCSRYGIPLIEDAAQALGSRFPDGRHIGTAGLVGTFSFSTPKIVSTGQGGCIVTDDDAVADRLRRLKDFGRSGGGNDIHDSIGFNFKFTDLQACVGLAQLDKLDGRVERKKEIWNRYSENLAGVEDAALFEHDLDKTTPWFIDAIFDDRDAAQASLSRQGVGTRPMYPPINAQQAYRYPGSFPVSEWIGASGLWLPSSVQLRDDQIDRICSIISGLVPMNRSKN